MPIRDHLFLEQNSPYFCQKPRKADAYRRFLTRYCAKISYFKEILLYRRSAYAPAAVFFVKGGSFYFKEQTQNTFASQSLKMALLTEPQVKINLSENLDEFLKNTVNDR